MIQGQWFSPGKDVSPVLPVRLAVFDRGADALDSESWNALVFEDNLPAACGRIWYRSGVYWLSDIGVLESRRGHHLGDLVLRLLLFKAQSHAASEVRLVSPDQNAGFFARLGFQPVSSSNGKTEMMIRGENIQLDNCSSCPRVNCPNRQ